jgi:hypothetical protein
MIEILSFLGYGKILQVFAKKFPPIQDLAAKSELLSKLYECNLCNGFWVFLVLAPFFKINMHIKNKYLRWVITACISSLLTYLISKGWEDEFGKLVIEDAYG